MTMKGDISGPRSDSLSQPDFLARRNISPWTCPYAKDRGDGVSSSAHWQSPFAKKNLNQVEDIERTG